MPMTIRDMLAGQSFGCASTPRTKVSQDEKSKRSSAMNKVNNINAERQSPNSVSTPLKKQEPTADIWKKGGAKSPEEALSTDKGSVRSTVSPGK